MEARSYSLAEDGFYDDEFLRALQERLDSLFELLSVAKYGSEEYKQARVGIHNLLNAMPLDQRAKVIARLTQPEQRLAKSILREVLIATASIIRKKPAIEAALEMAKRGVPIEDIIRITLAEVGRYNT